MLVLRDYQEVAKNELRDGFKKGHVRQILCASTGSGKSIIAASMILNAIEKGSKVLFIVERRILADQFSAHLDKFLVPHGVIMAKHWRWQPHQQVQIASAQTIERMESLPAFDLCIIDEVHACMRASVMNMMETRPHMKTIGLTASPFNAKIPKYFTNVTSVTTMKQLVSDGHLVPFRVFVAHEIDTKGLKVVAGEWQKDELEKRGQQIVGDVVSDYIRISNEVYGGYRKTICFSCGIAHGADLAQKFQDSGINAVQISSEDDDEYKAEVLREFAKPDTDIKVVISVAILSRGFDQSDVDHVILARPLKKSFSEHVQMIGRGARPHEGKLFATLQDHSGNFLRFKDDWDTLYNDGVTELGEGQDAKSRKEPSEKEKKEAKCPKCSVVWAGGDVCLNCGHVRERRSDVVAVPGEMSELGDTAKSEKFTSEFKEAWYQSMLGHLRDKGKNENRAYHLYKERFGVAPAWKKEYLPATPEVIGYLKKADIAYSFKRKAVIK